MNNELYHHGIKGQRWGVRRYETESGHLTKAGKERYDDYDHSQTPKKSINKSTVKKVAVGAAITATAVASIYGGYKVSRIVNTNPKVRAAGRNAVYNVLSTTQKIGKKVNYARQTAKDINELGKASKSLPRIAYHYKDDSRINKLKQITKNAIEENR